MDDNAKISIGEPHLAVGFGGRGGRSILPYDVNAVADDQIYKVVSLTPSEILRVHTKPYKGEDTTSYCIGMFL
jgi:hypothetical protein